MTTFYFAPDDLKGPPTLRHEMVLSVGEENVALFEATARDYGLSLEDFMEAVWSKPGGLCDAIKRDHLTAADVAEIMQVARLMEDMDRFFGGPMEQR